MFVDKESIIIKSGDGGDGAVSFIRYKGVADGGPDGGDGGNGGDVYFVADKGKNSLVDFMFKRKFCAENGTNGGAKKCRGKDGENLIIPVPLGTVISDAETGAVIADIFYEDDKKLVLPGGRGGKGNSRFCTARRHTPHFSQKGAKTTARRVFLELKIIADVGLVGFPNAGKSTTLSKISAAKPKIADYHFTTLSPNLGVVKRYDKTMIVADVPGLIEGAAEGAGLGHEFLRHIERTRIIIHVVDVSGKEERSPINDFEMINKELLRYKSELKDVVQLVALNKCDIYGAEENAARFIKKYGKKYKIFKISAIKGEGLDDLVKAAFEELEKLPAILPISYEEFSYQEKSEDDFEIIRDEDGAFVVVGGLVGLLERNVVLNDVDSLRYLQKTLKDKGVVKALKKAGCKDGDVVVIGETEFDFVE